MKYSKQQIRDIDRHYENLKRQIQLTNLRSKGLQSVLVDKIIPDSILDKRNSNDIENDKFAETQLFNDYSNDIIKTGDVYKFQSDIDKGGYKEFFINNFSRIKKEVQMYQIANGENVLNTTKKLFNQEFAALKSFDDRTNELAHDQSMLGELQQISANLQTLAHFAANNDARNQYINSQNKIDAVIACIGAVGSDVQVLKSLFQINNPNLTSDQINQSLQQLTQQTTPPSNPSAQLPAPPSANNNPLIAQITPQVLQNAMNQLQNKQQTKQQNVKQQAKKQQTILINTDITTLTDQDIQDWKDLILNPVVKDIKYAKLLSDLIHHKKSPQDFMLKGGKEGMYNYFKSIKDNIVQEILAERGQAKEAQLKQQEEDEYLKKKKNLSKNKFYINKIYMITPNKLNRWRMIFKDTSSIYLICKILKMTMLLNKLQLI